MSVASRNRRVRVRDFLRRARFSQSEVETHGHWRYIRVHPLADESDLLSQIGTTPADCDGVDAWLYTGDDVLLLQVRTAVKGKTRKPCCVARWEGDPPYLQIHARVAESLITFSVLRAVLKRLETAGIPRRRFCRGKYSRKLKLCTL
jgi:hypothetical protein